MLAAAHSWRRDLGCLGALSWVSTRPFQLLRMKAAAANLEFEKAAKLRDRIKQLRTKDLGLIAGSRN